MAKSSTVSVGMEAKRQVHELSKNVGLSQSEIASRLIWLAANVDDTTLWALLRNYPPSVELETLKKLYEALIFAAEQDAKEAGRHDGLSADDAETSKSGRRDPQDKKRKTGGGGRRSA